MAKQILTDECTYADLYPFQQLQGIEVDQERYIYVADGSSALKTEEGCAAIASRKADYITAFGNSGLLICEEPPKDFAIQSSLLRAPVKKPETSVTKTVSVHVRNALVTFTYQGTFLGATTGSFGPCGCSLTKKFIVAGGGSGVPCYPPAGVNNGNPITISSGNMTCDAEPECPGNIYQPCLDLGANGFGNGWAGVTPYLAVVYDGEGYPTSISAGVNPSAGISTFICMSNQGVECWQSPGWALSKERIIQCRFFPLIATFFTVGMAVTVTRLHEYSALPRGWSDDIDEDGYYGEYKVLNRPTCGYDVSGSYDLEFPGGPPEP